VIIWAKCCKNSCKTATTEFREFSLYIMADGNSCPWSVPSLTDT